MSQDLSEMGPIGARFDNETGMLSVSSAVAAMISSFYANKAGLSAT
jgi:hypothetical protein